LTPEALAIAFFSIGPSKSLIDLGGITLKFDAPGAGLAGPTSWACHDSKLSAPPMPAREARSAWVFSEYFFPKLTSELLSPSPWL
jgi:hypothetical protein